MAVSKRLELALRNLERALRDDENEGLLSLQDTSILRMLVRDAKVVLRKELKSG